MSILVGVVVSTGVTPVADGGAAMPVDSDGSDVDQPPGSPNSEEADEVEGPIDADGDGGAEASDPGAQDAPTAQENSPTGQTADRIVRGYDAAVPITFDVFGVTDRSVWNVKVSRARDITAEVLAANDRNDAPPQGLIYAGYDVEITLASARVEPLATGLNISWQIVGGASADRYYKGSFVRFVEGSLEGPYGCGNFPDEFSETAEVFVGGTVSGTVCMPLPAEDVDHPDTNVTIRLGESTIGLGHSWVLFLDDGDTPPPADVDQTSGPPAAGPSFAIGEGTDLRWDVPGEANGSIWTTTIGPWSDMTADFTANNQINRPLPNGVAFAAFDVELTLVSAPNQPLSTGLDAGWEMLGGATRGVYGTGGFFSAFGCGHFDWQLSPFADVFAGETLRGTVCLVVPTEDLDHSDTRISLKVGEQRFVFGPA